MTDPVTPADAPTEDRFGGTYGSAFGMALALGLTRKQFYGLLHAAVLRNDLEVDAWDDNEAARWTVRETTQEIPHHDSPVPAWELIEDGEATGLVFLVREAIDHAIVLLEASDATGD